MQMLINVGFILGVFIAVNADIYDDAKNSRNFTGKVVLVTGSSTGIGEATVKLFSSFGASVVVTGRNQTNVKRVADETQKLSPHGLKPLEIVADISKEEDAVHLINETIAEFGQIDVLVNNAGALQFGLISDADILSKYDDTMNLEVRAAIHLIHVSLPFLKQSKGTIINISSIGGLKPLTGLITHNLAKASLEMLTKVLAVELGSYGIRVNSINPGNIQTKNNVVSDGSMERYLSLIPLKSFGKPVDIAAGIAFLASNDAQYITGTNLVIDGGAIHNIPANFFSHNSTL